MYFGRYLATEQGSLSFLVTPQKAVECHHVHSPSLEKPVKTIFSVVWLDVVETLIYSDYESLRFTQIYHFSKSELS